MIEVRQTEEFRKWLDRLKDRKAKAVIVDRAYRLQRGLFGDVQPVGEGVSELRIHIGPGYRIYFVKRGNTVVILLCGGSKRSQNRDIERAKNLAREIRS